MSIVNPGFENGDSGWVKGTSWTIVQNSGFSRDGTWAARWDGGNGSDSEIVNEVREPVAPGQSVTASMYGSTNGANTSQGGVVVLLVWFDASGTRLGKTEGNIIRGGGTALQQSTVMGTAPNGAATVSVGANAYRNSNPRPYFVDTFTWNIVRNRTIQLTQPTNNQEIAVDQQVPLRVTVGGDAPAITSVSYLINGVEERIVTTAPYGVNLPPQPIGVYTVQARLNLVDGTTVLSNTVTINVVAVPEPPTVREYKASNSYTYLIGENFISLGGSMPPTARVLGIEVLVDYTIDVLVRSKDVGIADPAQANYDVAFAVVDGGTVEAVLLNNDGTAYTQLGAPMSNTLPINRSDFTVTEDGTSEGMRWTVLEGVQQQVVIGAEDQRFGLTPEFGSTFINYGVGLRFTPNLAAVPSYADAGDASYRFKVESFKVRVYFDAGSVEYYFASADKAQVLKGSLAAYYVYTGNFTTNDATGVLQLAPTLEQMDGTQRWIGSDWTIHSSYPPTDINQIGQVGEIEEDESLGMKYNALPTQKQVRDNRSRYEFKTENFYGSTELNSMYGVHGLPRAFAYNGDFFYKIYTQADAEKDKPRHVANHHGHLALGYYGGRVDISVAGEPYNFEGVDGASSWAFGDKVVGLLPLSGTILGVFGAKSVWGISGTTVDNFATQVISPNMGAVEYTITDMGFPVYANSYGIYTLNQTQQYGDYLGQPMSQDISPWLRPRLIRKLTSDKEVVCAFPVRSKNQYRLCFSDGYVTSMTLNGQQTPTFSFQKYFYTPEGEELPLDMYSYPAIVPAAVSSELDEAGEERIHLAPYEPREEMGGDNLPPLNITGSLSQGVVGIYYSSTLGTTGFNSLVSAFIIEGTLPEGIELSTNKTTKQLEFVGTPEEEGRFTITVRAYDVSGRSALWEGVITINRAAELIGMRHASNDANQVIFKLEDNTWTTYQQDLNPPWINVAPLWASGNFLLGKNNNATYKWPLTDFSNRISITTTAWVYLQTFGPLTFFFGNTNTSPTLLSSDYLATNPSLVNWGGRRINGIGRLPNGRWVTFISPTSTARVAAWTDEEVPLNWNNVTVGTPSLGETTNNLYLLASSSDRVFYVANNTTPTRCVQTLDGITWNQGGQLASTTIGPTCQTKAWDDGVCIHVTTQGQTFRSVDNGTTWTQGPVLALGGTGELLGGSLTRGEDRILLCPAGSATKNYYTDDFGLNWTELPVMPQPGNEGATSCVYTDTGIIL